MLIVGSPTPVTAFGVAPVVSFFSSSVGDFLGNAKAPPSGKVIEAARKVMENTGYFDPLDEALFADDFIFRGPVIGPLNKPDYIDVLDYFKIYEAFPDIDTNCFGFTIDPKDPYRVWFFLRATGTYQKPLGGPAGKVLKPNNQVYQGSVETWSILLDGDLKCKLITAGYVSDRFDDQATTDGIGLSFGILKTLGLSFPSGPGNIGLRIIQGVNGPFVKLGIAPKAVSDPSEVPAWWKNEKRGADP